MFWIDRLTKMAAPAFFIGAVSPLKPLNRIQKKIDRKQDLNFRYYVCVFRADWNTKMDAPAFGLQKHKCIPSGLIHAEETSFSTKSKVVKDD